MTREQLLPDAILESLPTYDSTLETPRAELTAQVKFFYPDFGWTWYVVARDGDDWMWGLVDGFEKEVGPFLLSELLLNRGKLGCAIERDLYFKPTLLADLLPAS